MAMELGASVIFASEHSDKTFGSIREMRRATEMMALTADRHFPKDLGIDLLGYSKRKGAGTNRLSNLRPSPWQKKCQPRLPSTQKAVSE